MKAKYIPYLIIITLLIIIGVMRQCRVKTVCPEVKTQTIIKDSIITKTVDKWHPAPKPMTVVDTFKVPAKVDTALILSDYFKLRIYKRVLGNDSSGYATLTDSVNKNKLLGYSLKGEWKTYVRTIEHTKIVTPASKRKMFVGPSVIGGVDNLGIAASAMYINRQDQAYSVSVDPFQRQAIITAWFKIKLKK